MKLRLRCTGDPVLGFGDRLRAAERLIRLGARASVVNEVLAARGVLRALIRRLYAALRGPGRPRGPLPIDLAELLSRPAARLQASLFLDGWMRLRAAGLAPAQALACAWEHLDSVCDRAAALPSRLSIDHAWVLAGALERGGVAGTHCPDCRRRYFDLTLRQAAPALPMQRTRCPHCAPEAAPGALEARQAIQRAATLQATVCALRVAAPHPLSDLAQRHDWAERLFRAGARPPTVTHATGLPMNGLLRQLFIEVVGHSPRQGALPQLGEHVISTYARKLQASVLLVTAERLRRAGYPPAELLLQTWDGYRSLFGAAARFDINAVALILRARQHPDFALIECRHCRAHYLELRLALPGSQCPVCRELRHAGRVAA